MKLTALSIEVVRCGYLRCFKAASLRVECERLTVAVPLRPGSFG
jgi:hypothetical protein